jgi:hypothetical protein
MATIRKKNFSRGKLSRLDTLGIQNGDTFQECNFVQENPNTTVLSGYTGLTFIACNLMNCSVPGDAVIDDCLTIQKSMCSNLHSSWSITPTCATHCRHVIEKDTVTIDSELIDTIYHYADGHSSSSSSTSSSSTSSSSSSSTGA